MIKTMKYILLIIFFSTGVYCWAILMEYSQTKENMFYKLTLSDVNNYGKDENNNGVRDELEPIFKRRFDETQLQTAFLYSKYFRDINLMDLSQKEDVMRKFNQLILLNKCYNGEFNAKDLNFVQDLTLNTKLRYSKYIAANKVAQELGISKDNVDCSKE